MVANGLAKGEGACIKAALARCAGALPAAAELGAGVRLERPDPCDDGQWAGQG